MGAAATVPVAPVKDPQGEALCGDLAVAVATYVADLCAAYERAEEMRLVADCNALQSVIEDVEKLGWMLRSHVV